MSRQVVVPLAVLALTGTPLTARAQAAPDTARQAAGDRGARPAALCWIAHPAPRCRVLLLTDVGGYVDLGAGGGARASADAGLMLNVSRRGAVGVTYYATMDESGLFTSGPAVRYRRWLGATSAVEAAVGFRGGAELIDKGAVVAMIKYNFSPEFGVVLRPELLFSCPQYGGVCARTEPSSRLRVAVGVELGSWLGLASSAVLGFVAGVVSAATPHIM